MGQKGRLRTPGDVTSSDRPPTRPNPLGFAWFLLPAALAWSGLGSTGGIGTQTVQMGWWGEFSVARIFDSPTLFATVMSICGLFVLFYIVMAVRAGGLERAAAVWAANRGLAELVSALDTADGQLAFVRIRHLRSERFYRRLLNRLPAAAAAKEVQMLLGDLPDDEKTGGLDKDLLSSESGKKTRREALIHLFERRDEQVKRLLMARLKEVRESGSVSVFVVYLLEDLAASEARPFLERLLSRGDIPRSILRNALRRIPQPQEAKAK